MSGETGGGEKETNSEGESVLLLYLAARGGQAPSKERRHTFPRPPPHSSIHSIRCW